MSEHNKHTPGPWEICGDVRAPAVRESRSRYVLAHFGNRCEHDERLANARLMAAAPELLEFVSMIARLQRYDADGQQDGTDAAADAIEVLNSLITRARALMKGRSEKL